MKKYLLAFLAFAALDMEASANVLPTGDTVGQQKAKTFNWQLMASDRKVYKGIKETGKQGNAAQSTTSSPDIGKEKTSGQTGPTSPGSGGGMKK